MASLSRILVPVEFSPRCRGAVQYAEALACHFQGEIILLHVVLPPLASYSSFEAMAYSSATDLAQEVATECAADLGALPCKAPGGVRHLVVIGDPAVVICDVAKPRSAARSSCRLTATGLPPLPARLGNSQGAHDAICPVCTSAHGRSADYTSISFNHGPVPDPLPAAKCSRGPMLVREYGSASPSSTPSGCRDWRGASTDPDSASS